MSALSPRPTRRRSNDAAARLPLLVLLADTFTMALGFYMLVPLLAYHLLNDLSLTIVVVGVLAAIRSGSQQGLMPWSGHAGGPASATVVPSRPGCWSGPAASRCSPSWSPSPGWWWPACWPDWAVRCSTRRATRCTRRSPSGRQPGGGLLLARDAQQPRLRRGSRPGRCARWDRLLLGLPGLRRAVPRRRSSSRCRPAQRTRGRDRASAAAGPCAGSSATAPSCGTASGSPEGGCCSPSSTWRCRCAPTTCCPAPSGLGTVYSVAAIVMVVTMLPLTGAADRWLRPTTAPSALGTVALGAGLLVLGVWESVAGLVRRRRRLHPRPDRLPADHELHGLDVRPEDSIASYFGVHGLALAVGGILGGVGGGALYGFAGHAGSPLLQRLPEIVFAVWGVAVAVFLVRGGRAPGARPRG